MHLLIWYTCVILLLKDVNGNEEITQEYIQKFSDGLTQFAESSQTHVFKDGTYDPSKYDEHAALANAEEYDFIVVGAGAAGSVIASRLSEVPEWKVLLLEAGDMESPYGQVPGYAGVLQGSKYNWGYLTETQESWCLGMIDNKCTAPTGKGMGGGTAINGMVYTRGNPRDYDLWADQGNDGWCYDDVLPYFKKAEDCALPNFDHKYHNQGGPLYVEEPPHASPILDVFLAAGKELGLKTVDYNGKEQLGFSKTQTTTKHGVRNSASRAYLSPHERRRNLHVKPLSHVTQILIKPHTKDAYGVKYVHNDTLFVAKASKEVVVTAGPFNSPQLLMLSGIGPREDLEKLGIPVIADLQVGRHVKDHIGFQGPLFLLNVTKMPEGSLREQVATWLQTGKGPLSASGIQSLAYVKTEAAKDPGPYPDVELILVPSGFAPQLRIRNEYKYLLAPESGYASYVLVVMPTHPKSVGTVKLASSDPFHAPVINLNQLNDPEGHDIDTMLSGIKKAKEVIGTNAFQKVGAHLYEEPVKDCKKFGFGSDAYWKCAARHLSISLRHQTGSCKMGPRTDKYAVVDNKLHVYGVNKLRVADSSVIPVSITGHTHAASNMVGEKAAELIKEQWK